MIRPTPLAPFHTHSHTHRLASLNPEGGGNPEERAGREGGAGRRATRPSSVPGRRPPAGKVGGGGAHWAHVRIPPPGEPGWDPALLGRRPHRGARGCGEEARGRGKGAGRWRDATTRPWSPLLPEPLGVCRAPALGRAELNNPAEGLCGVDPHDESE